MADIKSLEDSVAKATEKVVKCKATITRHEKSLEKKLAALAKEGITLENMGAKKWQDGVPGTGGSAHYWDICSAESKQNDIKGAQRKLRDAEIILNNWQSKLDVEVEKERFLSEQAPAVIIKFLYEWKEKARDWYIKAHASYLELDAKYHVAKRAAEENYLRENPGARTWGKEYDKAVKGNEEVRSLGMRLAMLGGAVATMATYRQESERLAWLERMLEEDRKAKLFDLIHRINDVVGTITDASYLRVSEKGNLDGFIIGEKGKAEIQTIGAGGYNIQVFHYRTLVHEIK